MKDKFYSNERSVQMLIYLLKTNNIKKVIVSPGATNVTFVGSIQQDPFFEIYSSVDERSAGYMACGMAAESGEPVVLSCTGATASRNYVPALTEAFYRKLPVLAVTSTQYTNRVGHMIAQVIDRSVQMNDLVNMSVQIPATITEDDEWSNNVKLNMALLELKHRGGGPVHINLTTTYSRDFSVKTITPCRSIKRITVYDDFPQLPKGRICVFIGNHRKFSDKEAKLLDDFCQSNNAVVIGDHTSGYKGKFYVQASLLYKQEELLDKSRIFDLEIHLGEVYGDVTPLPKEVWRVNEDGLIKDPFRKLTYVFEMPELEFFAHYIKTDGVGNTHEFQEMRTMSDELIKVVPELPFSNTWIAQQTASKIPENSVLHLGILNSLRNWDMFETVSSVHGYSNTGGFGIDGILSTALGASLCDKNKLVFVILGDLAFFYDMNALGNRHLSSNLRIMVVNNGKGTEFTNYNHPGAEFGEQTSLYIAAGGHFGNQSRTLLKNYAENLGIEYLSAENKSEYITQLEKFVSSKVGEKPILFEVFTDSKDESDSLYSMYHIKSNVTGKAASVVKSMVSEEQKQKIRKILKF